jgi:hypothetical protein
MARNQSIARNTRISVIVALCFAILTANSVLAQTNSSASQDQWQYSGAIYLWGADIGGNTIGGSEVEVGFSDLLDNLEIAFMGAFEARKNNWSFLADVIYLDLGVDNTADLSIPIGGSLLPVTTMTDLDLNTWVLQFAGGYGLYSEGDSRLDLVAGARYLDLSMDLFLGLQSALGPGQSRTISDSLTAWDGIVGLKGQASLGERWFLSYYVDVGAGDSDLTWQAIAGIGYRAGRIWNLALLYRHLEWDFDSTRVIDDINFSGPTLGVIFRW